MEQAPAPDAPQPTTPAGLRRLADTTSASIAGVPKAGEEKEEAVADGRRAAPIPASAPNPSPPAFRSA